MVVQEIQKNYVFPRIPLKFQLPDNYPEVGCISSISVVPEIRDFRLNRGEIEIRGSYQVTVSYFEALKQSEPDKLREIKCDDFFSYLQIQADGLITDSGEEPAMGTGQSSQELNTVQFERPFHTFVDLEFISRPRTFKPGLIIERVDLEAGEGHSLKGELVLSLVNRPRRTYR